MRLTKRQNTLQIKLLDIIYTKGPISRIDIAKETGITPATVSEISGNLINERLIHETGEVSSPLNKSGRKKILLDISPNHSFYIGVELSEKFFSYCLIDNRGSLFEQKTIQYNQLLSESNLTKTLFIDELHLFIKQCSAYQPKAIGIALPGHFDEITQTILTNNLFWENFNLDQLLSEIVLPIYFKNNVQCMALSERLFSVDKKMSNFTFLHVGRGMFCSSIYQNNLYGDNAVLVGEVGHIVVHPDGELCECGKRGCLQTYTSESWIIKKSQILFDNSDSTYLRQLATNRSHLTIETILQAYKLGDEGVINILHNAIKYLSITLNNLSMMIDMDKMIIHGELFTETQLSDLINDYLENNSTLLVTEKKIQIEFKPYSPINGAISAAGFCVIKQLLS
ncbi:MAG: ROK family protein [Carnobacterium sp.]|uniref:ROK family transcriptional regulator n=1 Tax=Carnobacterium sp. TaxID=48221 RepID=UPI0033157C94